MCLIHASQGGQHFLHADKKHLNYSRHILYSLTISLYSNTLLFSGYTVYLRAAKEDSRELYIASGIFMDI
jgi:hypothetical protein